MRAKPGFVPHLIGIIVMAVGFVLLYIAPHSDSFFDRAYYGTVTVALGAVLFYLGNWLDGE
jgi:uncharacterized membrane protein